MADRQEQWNDLWKAEKTTCTEFTGHWQIRDWSGYKQTQEDRRKQAAGWLRNRVDDLKAGDPDVTDNPSSQKTKNRIAYIEDVLDGYCKYWWPVPNYPRDHATDDESARIKERTYYCSFFGEGKAPEPDKLSDCPYGQQQKRRDRGGGGTDGNYQWLEDQRKWISDCADGKIEGKKKGWDVDHRRQRWENLAIATHYGQPWDEWRAGTYRPSEPAGGGDSDWREKSEKWHESHLGITESPADSNCDSRSDGIRNAQDTCANGTWLRYQPWCGVWAFMGLYQSGKVKSGTDSWMASVASIEDYAKAGKGPFRGWTTDGSKAKKGDLVVLFGRGQHVGTVRSIDASYAYTWEGNTSSGSSGSQSNGGGSYKRSRSRSSETYGYALVRD